MRQRPCDAHVPRRAGEARTEHLGLRLILNAGASCIDGHRAVRVSRVGAAVCRRACARSSGAQAAAVAAERAHALTFTYKCT